MSREKRLDKLKSVPEFAGIDHRFFLDEQGRDRRLSLLPRKERRKLAAESRKLARRYNEILVSIRDSGVGYPVDKLLRDLAVEYTHRYASSGVATQPASFNYFESFCSVDLIEGSVAPYTRPVPEVDHLFSVPDYFDYLTAADTPTFNLSELLSLPEGQAHHFTQNGNINDFTYMTSEGREFLISGFSMVRHGTSLHWYILGGEVLPEEEWKSDKYDEQIDINDVPPQKARFLSDAMKITGPQIGRPIALEGTKTAIRTIIAGETDVSSGKHVARCHMSETENSFQLFCDDPDIFETIQDHQKRENIIQTMKERVESAAVMWHLAEGFFQLPRYFQYRLTVSPTVVTKSAKPTPKTTRGGRGVGARFRHVTSIEVSDTRQSVVVRSYTAPHLEVETEGHWRRLEENAYGFDAKGNQIRGRTWIAATNKWRARPDKTRPVYIKSLIAAARIQVAEYLEAAQQADAEFQSSAGQEKRVLYVMRCLAMQDEVYKVGWTSNSAEQRARELSTATGVPMSFAVVDAWPHDDPEALEKGVHAMLDPYRLNAGREFFKLKYPDLKAIIEAEIRRTNDVLVLRANCGSEV